MRYKFRITIIITIIFINLIFSVNSVIPNTNLEQISIYHKFVHIPHDPIQIIGNEDFTPDNGVIGGNGTKQNPYIISNWIIESDNESDSGIVIINTTSYCMITNIIISNFSSNDEAGIKFKNVQYGDIDNVLLNHNYYGIRIIDNSSKISVSNCIINGVVEAYATCISCSLVSNIQINYCQFQNSYRGIRLYDTVNCIISNSNISKNQYALRGSGSLQHNITIIDSIFFDNNKGVDFYSRYENRHNTIILVKNCHFIYNGNFQPGIADLESSLTFWYVHDNIVDNCTFKGNTNGLLISASSNNIVRNCSFLSHKVNNSLANHAISISGGFIPQYSLSRNITIIHCTIKDNEGGIITGFSFDVTIKNNLIQNNSEYGILSVMGLSHIYNNNIINNFNELMGGLYGRFSITNACFNWWGSPTGPKRIFNLGEGDSIDKLTALIFFRPWLTDPAPGAGRQT
jgi:parallel beta-helix repeat protein